MTEPQNISPDDFGLAAEYVLGVLPMQARQDFALRLRDDRALQDAVTYWEEHFSPLADEVEPVKPPSGSFARIERRLFGRIETPARQRGFLGSLALWRGLTVGAVTVAAAMWVMKADIPVPDPAGGGTVLVSQISGEQSGLTLAALYDTQTGNMRITRAAGQAPSGRVLELWVIAGQDAPVSLGVLPDDPRAELVVPEPLAAVLAGAVLAISDEPPGGSPTGQPTGSVLATGQVTAL